MTFDDILEEMIIFSKNRKVGPESQKTWLSKLENGFFDKYMNHKGVGLDIGFKGNDNPNGESILPWAIGVDKDYPGYDGTILPFEDKSQDFVYNSHVLEHIEDWQTSIQEWFRVLKVGGYLVIVVPHQWIYEKKVSLPSRFNADHKRFYTASSLCLEIEQSLLDKTYRIRHLKECDEGNDYNQPDTEHSNPVGLYEIEIVVEKIA